MAAIEREHHDYSKRDRILNALEAYPDDDQIDNQLIAELTDASASYVYQLRAALDEGELTEDELESTYDDELQAQYRDRIRELTGESDDHRSTGARAMRSATAVEPEAPETGETPTEPERNGAVSVTDVEHVREVMERYREDAEFERKRFEGSGKNVAEEKYFIANRAVELLDEVIDG